MGSEQQHSTENTNTCLADKVTRNFFFKESGKIIAISTFAFAVAAFFLKSLWYFYQWGKFAALKVPILYIDMGNGNQALYSAMAYSAVVFVFLLSNIFVCNLMKKKKYTNIAYIILIEYTVSVIVIKIISNIKIKDLFYEITKENEIFELIKILIFIFIIICVLNLWGLTGLVVIKSENNAEPQETTNSHFKNIVPLFVMIIVIIIVQLLAFFLSGHWEGAEEENFKLIFAYESKADLIGLDEKYMFSDDSTDSIMVLQAVLVETQNEYVTCYCYEENEQIYANINMQKVISKGNIITFNGHDIKTVLQ